MAGTAIRVSPGVLYIDTGSSDRTGAEGRDGIGSGDQQDHRSPGIVERRIPVSVGGSRLRPRLLLPNPRFAPSPCSVPGFDPGPAAGKTSVSQPR
ncbi:hypothetical protein WISP_23454 [Willisornis vidua]|uniref:Uncharacterized protein n=1 Tax=Willisornis vidua TaxID=1566151 RepID=A0ABQ9DSQ3_9PASS|nr:hypothetical protein WISP_23454 [Willisornis vidua]